MQFFITVIAIAFFLIPSRSFAQVEIQDCFTNEEIEGRILNEVYKKNPNAIKALPACFKLNRKLILKAVIIDPSQFQYAADILKADQNFVRRLVKVNAEILQFASQEILSDATFMEQATYLNRTALRYANPKLLDNKLFIKEMIMMDSKNYIFASDRLKEIPEYAQMALSDDGLLLAFATNKIKSDKALVIIAIKSNNQAFEYASEELKLDKELQKLAAHKSSIKSKEVLEKFLQKNYLVEEKKKNLGFKISNQGKFGKKHKIINHNYITKWQRYLNYDINYERRNDSLKLISADSRNYPPSWKKDFKKYSGLSDKIEKFFLNHNIDRATIDNLSTTYLWKIKDKPLTLVFNLYLLRDSKDIDLGTDFADITSLTAIVQKQGKKWHISIVEVIFDSETKVGVPYPNGHKRYIVWDTYLVDKKDKNPKIIFKVEDRFIEYFEIFEEQSGGKYRIAYRIDPIMRKN